MISRRSIRMCGLLMKLSIRFGAAPYIFLGESQQLIINPEGYRRMTHTFNGLALWAILSFFMLVKFYREGDVERFHVTLAYWFGGVMVVSVFSIIRFFSGEVAQLLNSALRFFRHLQGYFMPGFDTEKHILNKMWDGCMGVCALLIAMVFSFIALLCLYDPTSTIFLGGFFSEEYFYWPVRLLLSFFHGYLIFAVGTNLVVTVAFLSFYIFYLVVLLSRELNLGCRVHLTREEFRTPTNLRMYYRGFQVLNAVAMSLIGWMLPVFHGIFIFLPTFLNVTLMRHWSNFRTLAKIPLVIGSPSLVAIWSVVIFLGRYLYTGGGKVMWSWRRKEWTTKGESKEMKKFMKSCKLVVLSHGTQFVIQKKTLFNYAKAVTRGTFKAVLATRRKH